MPFDSHNTLWIRSFSGASVRRKSGNPEIREAIATGKVIEDYPDDKYGASCLVFGFAANAKAVHVQCSHPSRPLIKIITTYEPDPAEWIGYEKRKGGSDE